MKDQAHGIPIEYFVGVQPKMYSIMYTDKNKQLDKKTSKGINRSTTKRQIRHARYKERMRVWKESWT